MSLAITTREQDHAVMYGAVLARLRKWRGLSAADFAERAGVSQPTVSRWERGVAAVSLWQAAKNNEVLELPSGTIERLTQQREKWQLDGLAPDEARQLLFSRRAGPIRAALIQAIAETEVAHFLGGGKTDA